MIIHEVARKLDMRNGDCASGAPAIPLRGIASQEHDLHTTMNNIQDEIGLVSDVARGIDAYAATDPTKCPAVLSEYLFSTPELFVPRSPILQQCFIQSYRQNPMEWLHDTRQGGHRRSPSVH